MDEAVDDIVIEWARKQDVFSDHVVYEQLSGYVDVSQAVRRGDHGTRRGPETVVIDIDKETIGTFLEQDAVVQCRRLGFVLLEKILAILAHADAFQESCAIVGTLPVQGKSTEPQLRLSVENRQQLEDACYFIVATQQVMRYASFFLVAKSNGHWRGVINGIPGNEVLAPPHYFVFFTPETWVLRLRRLGSFYGVAVDIKGQYNRLRWNADFAHYYAVHVGGGRIMVPSVLAMGAKAAVSIGQSVSWLVVAFVEEGEDRLGLVMPANPDMLPAVLDLIEDGRVVGCVFVCVDNIAVYHVSDAKKQLWVLRLRRNARRFGLDPFKEELHYDQSFCCFIGMHFSRGSWNHAFDRMERWQRRYGVVPPDTSSVQCTSRVWPLRVLKAKDIQRLVGVFVWDCRVRRLDISAELSEIFGVQYRACRPENPKLPSQAECAMLVKRWKRFQLNILQEWVEVIPPTLFSELVVLVSDASGGPLGRWSFLEMAGGLVLRAGGIHVNPSGPFEGLDVPVAIYYRETYSALLALRRLAAQGRRRLRVVLVIDSAALFGSLRKRMVPHLARAMFEEMKRLEKDFEWTLIPKWIESRGNVCDSATHLDAFGVPLPICPVREKRTWEVAMSEEYLPPTRSSAQAGKAPEKRGREDG